MHAYLDREYPIMIGTGLKFGVVVRPASVSHQAPGSTIKPLQYVGD